MDKSIQLSTEGDRAVNSSLVNEFYAQPLMEPEKLGTVDRSVVQENRAAIKRRWLAARDPAFMEDPDAMARWFPGQRDLLELLGSLESDHAQMLAECRTPLFTMRSVYGMSPTQWEGIEIKNGVDLENAKEVALALAVRLDAIRTFRVNAEVVFDLREDDVNALTRLNPIDLFHIAHSPLMVMRPAVGDQYFTFAAYSTVPTAQRTVFAATNRVSRVYGGASA